MHSYRNACIKGLGGIGLTTHGKEDCLTTAAQSWPISVLDWLFTLAYAGTMTFTGDYQDVHG